MKASINAKGVLYIKPETELEAYALESWGSHFPFAEQQNNKSTLLVSHHWPDEGEAVCHRCGMRGTEDNPVRGDDNRRDGNGYCRKCRGIA